MHPFNSTLWPWVPPNEIVGSVVLFFGEGSIILGFSRANMLFSVIMGVLGVLILIMNFNKKLWEEIWLGYSTPTDIHDRAGTNHSSNEI